MIKQFTEDSTQAEWLQIGTLISTDMRDWC